MVMNPRGPIVLVLAALGAIAAGCDRPTIAAKAGPAESKAGASAVAKVEVVRPARRAVRRTTEQPGQIEAAEVTPIYAKLSGYARTVAVDIGDRVTKGQVLAELWVPEVESDLLQKRAMVDQAEAQKAQAEATVQVASASLTSAEAQVAEAQAGIKRAQADRGRWQSEFDRTQQLVRERAVTASVLDEARSRLLGAEADDDTARAVVRSAEAARAEVLARVDKARADVAAAVSGIAVAHAEARHTETLLSFSRIEAPFDGIVTRRTVDTGHLTVPGAQGEPLFVVARADVVSVAVAVPETFAAAVEPGDPALVRLQALNGRTVEGKVTRTSFALDPATRTLRVEIDLPNPDGTLRPGLYANATIVAEEHPDALTVPTTAIVREGNRTFCTVVAGGRASRRPVEVGLSDGTNAEILSGLKADDVVVKANAASVAEGQPVEPIESAGTPPAAPKA